jgi:xanthine/uracil permease
MGTIVLLLGFLLLPAGVGLIAGPDPEAPGYASAENLLLGGTTLLVLLLGFRFLRGLLQQSAMLVAIALGTLVAVIAGAATFSGVGDGPVAALPDPFHFGAPEFELSAILTMLVISCVVMAEGIGQTVSVGETVGKPIGPDEITRSLRAEGVVNVVSGGVFQSLWYNTSCSTT